MTYPPAKMPPAHMPPHIQRAWIPVVLFPALIAIGFVLGSVLIGDPNDPASPHGWDAVWRVVVLWAAISALPALGVVWAIQAVRRGEGDARAPLAVDVLIFLLLTGLTLGGGLADAFK